MPSERDLMPSRADRAVLPAESIAGITDSMPGACNCIAKGSVLINSRAEFTGIALYKTGGARQKRPSVSDLPHEI